MSRAEYERVAQELYISYFGRPAGPAVIGALRLEVTRVDPAKLTFREGAAMRGSQGPTATEARRAQIKRNGGKR